MTPTVRSIPAAVADVLRGVHRMVVHERPYEEVVAAIVPALALPEATDPDIASLLALERLEVVFQYDMRDERRGPERRVTDEQVAAVLDETEAARALLPENDREWLLRTACWRRPYLAMRYLGVPLVEEEPAAAPERLDESRLIPAEVINGIRYVYRLRRMGWPYEEARAVLDEVATLPASAALAPQFATDRAILTTMYGRPEAELEQEILAMIDVHRHHPVKYAVSSVASACAENPALAERYVPPLLKALEADLSVHPDDEGTEIMARTARMMERLRQP